MSPPLIRNLTEDETESSNTPRAMPCMEVWGGHQATSEAVATTGLDAWIHSSPPPPGTDRDGASGCDGKSECDGEDVYLLSSCASGRISRVLLADASGYGSAVPQLAGELRNQMQRTINHIRQDDLVSAVNRQFVKTAGHYGFGSGLFATYFLPQRTLSVCTAGHPVPLIYRRSLRSWRFLEHPAGERCGERSIPLGLDGNTRYESCTTRVEQDDLVFCMTDALTGARAANGRPIGSGGLRTLLQSLGELSPQEVIPAILERLERFSGEALHQDRITALLLRINCRPVPLKDSLLAPVRLLGRLVRNRADRSAESADNETV